MIVLLAACSPLDRDETFTVEPGGYGVSVALRTVVFVPADASDGPVEVTLRAEDAPEAVTALDRFGVERDLIPAERVYHVTFEGELATPAWVGRWDPDAEGTLFTVVDSDDGWLALGWYEAPLVEVDPVLLHPGRSWFPTTTSLVHATAAE